MKEGLLQLLKLQEVDKKLFDLKEAQKKYPDEINLCRSEIAKAWSPLAEPDDKRAKAEKEQRRLEREIESAKADLSEREARFAVVTTNKEYEALQVEVDICKKTLAGHETELIKAGNDLKKAQKEIEEKQGEFEQTREEQQERIDELEGLLGTMQEQIDEVAAQRRMAAENMKKINARLLQIYERRQGRRGIRVAAVHKKACGACYYQMPAQMLNEVRSGDRVINCESCGAIMVWDEQSV